MPAEKIKRHRKLVERAHQIAEEVEEHLDEMVHTSLDVAEEARHDLAGTLRRAGERLVRAGERMDQAR